MTSKLPINLEDLLRQRTVEGDRIEYKSGWNPDAIVRTLCAFANDFENLGGGYIVIGRAEPALQGACGGDGQAQGLSVFHPALFQHRRGARRGRARAAQSYRDCAF